MSTIHPDWQAEEDDVPVTVRINAETQTTEIPEGKQISRRPAAAIGMIIVLAFGFSFFHGVEGLRGQLIESATKTIRITTEGFDPQRIQVAQGETISWVNTQDVPHIVESETLCDASGFCLLSSTLFNGDSDSFSITADIPSGVYEYTSSITEGMIGQIIVVADAVADTVNEPADDFIEFSNVLEDDFFDDLAANPPPPAPPPAPPGLPRNPYALGSERIHPFDSSGNPIPEAFGDDALAPSENDVAFTALQQGRGPLRQPDTGAQVWFVVLGSMAGLYAVTRNAFKIDV